MYAWNTGTYNVYGGGWLSGALLLVAPSPINHDNRNAYDVTVNHGP